MLGGHNRLSWEIHAQAIVEQALRCSFRLWSTRIAVVLKGGRFGGSGYEVHWVLRLNLSVSYVATVAIWRCDSTFDAYIESRLVEVDPLRGTAEPDATYRDQLAIVRMMQPQTILVVCCTWGMHYTMHTALGECFADSMQHSLYQHTHCLIMIFAVWDWKWSLMTCSTMMVEMWPERSNGESSWEWYGKYEYMWTIRCTTSLIGLRKPSDCVITRQIMTCNYHIGDATLTLSRYSLNRQFFITICRISSCDSHLYSELFSHL